MNPTKVIGQKIWAANTEMHMLTSKKFSKTFFAEVESKKKADEHKFK